MTSALDGIGLLTSAWGAAASTDRGPVRDIEREREKELLGGPACSP
jgi:hypothetical protein